MSVHPDLQQDTPSSAEREVSALYRQVLDGWNTRNADAFATLFVEIASTLQQIFAGHVTAPYVSKIRSVRLVRPEVAILRAIVGMVPPGQSALNPAVNAHQTLVAAKHDGAWRIELFQNTPAQFHGRPELVQQMTEELRQLVEYVSKTVRFAA